MFASSGFLLLSCVCLVSVVSSTRADSDEDICTEPPDPVNGYKSFNQGNRFGDAVEFRCFENATMVGVGVAVCMKNGRWTKEVPKCVLKVCPPLVAPRNGFIRGLDGASGFLYGMKYAIGCNQGYRLKGAEPGEEILTECLDNVTWSGQPAECQDRKIFHSRQEWSDFFTKHRYWCCAPWKKESYEWKPSCRGLSEGTKEECLYTGWTRWRGWTDDKCYYDEIEEYGSWWSHERRQVWYALLGVKVEKFGNQCCWTKNGQDYPCYESYTGAR